MIGRESLGDEPYTCLICHQLLRYPVHCRKCNSEYCTGCAARWQDTNNTCPLRCSSPWVLDESLSKNLLLKCPLGKTCKPLSPETFERHLEDCLRNRLVLNYQCSQQHPLSYMTAPKQIGCADCGKVRMARSICFECMELGETFLYYYCEKCRMPKFTKKSCPVEHEFVHMIPKGGFTCVGCQQTSSKKQRCYRDEDCKMTFCVGCYQKLPDRITDRTNEN